MSSVTYHENIIIGAGYAGLAAAAKLKDSKQDYQVLEAHTYAGGCASFFKRKDFVFDVGATTLSGVLAHQPIGKFFKILNIEPEIIKQDPGMLIYHRGNLLERHARPDKWVRELKKYYGGDQGALWTKIYNYDELAWQLIDKNDQLKPANLSEFKDLLNPENLLLNMQGLGLVRELHRPFIEVLKRYQLAQSSLIELFDEQLMISTQNTCAKTPALMAALGLAYPSEVYYPVGGMKRLVEQVAAKLAINFNTKIINIEYLENEDMYRLVDHKERAYKCRNLYANLTIWNQAKLNQTPDIKAYFKYYADKFTYDTSAFTLYFAVKSKANFKSVYHQIITNEKIPFCSSRGLFVTVSAAADKLKAPEGYRTVTVSTHTPAQEWFKLSKAEYKERKQVVENFIVAQLKAYLPELFSETDELLYLCSGTAKTFEYYTQRAHGVVGGLPFDVDYNLFDLVHKKVPKHRYYHLGDTGFPGQGIASVIYSGFSAVEGS